MIVSLRSLQSTRLNVVYEQTKQELDEFFNVEWTINCPRIFLVPDRVTFDALSERKTEAWVVGLTQGRDIFLLAPRKWGTESSHVYSKEAFKATLKHELTHSYLHVFFNLHHPTWLAEGICQLASGQLQFRSRVKKFATFLEYDEQVAKEVYKEAGWAVQGLFLRYGKEKFLHLLRVTKEAHSREEFASIFEKIYDFEPTYSNFNRLC